MKRTNLVLDAGLLEEATRLSGEKTYSGAVNAVLADYVKRARAQKILLLTGSGAWEGDLSIMREDAEVYAGSKKPPRKRAPNG
jgi:Arc/MetJ family transcription regulator